MSDTAFCYDCGHDRTVGDDVVSFAADPGWVAEFAVQMAEGETAFDLEVRSKDGSRWSTWTAEVIGWAVMERHFAKADGGGHERSIEPVLLEEDGWALPMSQYRENRDHLKGLHYRITRTPLSPAVGGAA